MAHAWRGAWTYRMRSGLNRATAFLGTREFLFGISVTALSGVALVIVGNTGVVWETENAWRQLMAGLGDALVIATVLALLVDLAAPKGYFRACTYRFTMDWAEASKDVLYVRLDVTLEATVLHPAGFNPNV